MRCCGDDLTWPTQPGRLDAVGVRVQPVRRGMETGNLSQQPTWKMQTYPDRKKSLVGKCPGLVT